VRIDPRGGSRLLPVPGPFPACATVGKGTTDALLFPTVPGARTEGFQLMSGRPATTPRLRAPVAQLQWDDVL